MAAFLVALSIWTTAIPGSLIGIHGSLVAVLSRGLFLVGIALAFSEHTRVLLSVKIKLPIIWITIAAISCTLASGVFAHGLTTSVSSDLLRQLYAVAFVAILSQLFRDSTFLIRLVRWYVIFALCVAAILLGLQLSATGLQNIGNFEALKAAKYELQSTSSIGLNSISYSIVTAILLGSGIMKWPQRRRWTLLAIVPVVLWVFASTTSIAALALAFISVLAMWLLIASFRVSPHIVSFAALFLWLIAPILAITIAIDVFSLPDEINELTTGRIFVWMVALQEFSANPTFGAGPFSWKESLLSGVMGLTEDTTRYELIAGGAYHNVFLTTLAERGLIGGIALAILVWLIFLYIGKVLGKATPSTKSASRSHTWVIHPIGVASAALLTLIRGIGEYSGPIAYANAHPDFVALMVVALLIATRYAVPQETKEKTFGSLGKQHAT